MFRLPAWEDVQIDVVAQNGGGDYRVLLMLGGNPIEGGEGLAVDHGPLFNPAGLVLLGRDFQETASVFQHLERLAVDHLGHTIGDGGHAVVQVHLPHGNVDGFVMHMAKARAPGGKRKEREQEQQG